MGAKSWRLGYRFNKKQKTYTIGQYPDVTRADARRAREELRHLLAQGIDPSAKKQEEKAAAARPEGMTFEAAALEWLERLKPEVTQEHAGRVLGRLRKYLFPAIGAIPMAELRPREVLAAVRVPEASVGEFTARRIARLVVALLRELKELDGDGEYVFPSPFSRARPISREGLLHGFRRLDIPKEKMCLHGFRSSASSLLNSMGRFPPDVIEAQLAHQERNAVRAAYNRADYLEQRREMMQVWADYVDDLRAGAISARRKRKRQ